MQTAVPQDITKASDDELATVETVLLAEFDKMIDDGSSDVAVLTEIAEAVESVRSEITNRAQAAEEAAQAVSLLAERLRPVAETNGDPEDDSDEEAEVAPEATEETTESEAIAPAETEERELVTASADKSTPKAPSASAVARRSVTPEAPKPQAEVVITAAADIPGYSGGASLDKVGIARAMHAKARTLSNGSGYIPVASIAIPNENKLGADLAYNMDVLDRVTDQSALTAAGWCAPSNNLYTLFGIDAGDGLIDLPTVQITRGGLNVPSFIGYDEAVENGGLWTWDETDQDDGEATKPCVYIPCPSFTDYRLEAEGICVTNGNLTDRAFPELTTRYISLVLNTHLHRVSGAIIQKIVTTAVNVTMSAVNTSAAGSILHAIDVQVADYRSKYRMSVNTVLETVFPLWTKELIRADLAMRTGVNLTNVSDADIVAHFAVRKVRAQFVHDYQPMSNPASPTYGGAATAFPGTLDFLLYPAGGYVRGDGGVIDLGVVRDSVLNATNDYTAAWTEQMYLVAQLGPKARRVQLSGFDPLGVTGCCPTPVVG
jgi:hypothetical protein